MKVGDTVRPSGYILRKLRDYWLSCGRHAEKSAAKDALKAATDKRGKVTKIEVGKYTPEIVTTAWGDGTETVGTALATEDDRYILALNRASAALWHRQPRWSHS